MISDVEAGAVHLTAPAPNVSGSGRILVAGPTTIQRVPLCTICVPSNRHAMDLDFIREGTFALLADPDADLPPVLLLRSTPTLHWLVEGRHRFASTLAAGRSDILAAVTDRILGAR